MLFNTENRYQGYAYSYPHKLAYRPFKQPYFLESLWDKEDTSNLFLYTHIPFCEMRCGFCNLFTITNPDESYVSTFLRQLKIQAEVYKRALGRYAVAKVAIGGGTPTFLSEMEMEQLVLILKDFGVKNAPLSVEVSPKTVTKEKLLLLQEIGLSRMSIGIQSFIEAEAHEMGRPQKNSEVYRALERMRTLDGVDLSLDFIYGSASQTVQSWIWTLEEAMNFEPEELYLYPLYIRPLTGLGNKGEHPDTAQHRLYEAGKEFLLSKGYEQYSMRMFRKSGLKAQTINEYSCQEDGMVGLGAGARSYTRQVHYSTEFAVARQGIKSILQHYLESDETQFNQATYGIELNEVEQKTRYLIKSVLHKSGLNPTSYANYFGSDVINDFPVLHQMEQEGYLYWNDSLLLPTSLTFDNADRIGPALYSQNISSLIAEAELK